MTSKSSTTTREPSASLAPLHPGEVLREEFMVPLGLTAYAVAKGCRVPRTRIERIVREETSVTADTALRLGRLLGTSAEFWLRLQSLWDIESSRAKIGSDLEQIPLLHTGSEAA